MIIDYKTYDTHVYNMDRNSKKADKGKLNGDNWFIVLSQENINRQDAKSFIT